jgi:hypothetical protein
MNEDKQNQIEFQMGELVSTINSVVPVYKDTSQPSSNDLIRLKLDPKSVLSISYLINSCKRLCDLNKDLPELFEQKNFMEPILKPSITHKELNDFLKESFNMKDFYSKESFNVKDQKSIDKIFDKLKSGPVTDRIFCLIKKKRGIDHIHVHWKKSPILTGMLEIHKKSPDKEFFKNALAKYLITCIHAVFTASLTWEQLGSYVSSSLKNENFPDSFHFILDFLNHYFTACSQEYMGAFFPSGQKVSKNQNIAPDPRSLGKLKPENLEFVKLELDPSDIKKIFKIMSNLDFSPKNISRFDFERMAVSLNLSIASAIFHNKKAKPSFNEFSNVNFLANTRTVDLAFKVLGLKEGKTIFIRGRNPKLSHLYERGGELLKTKSKNVLYSTAKSDLEINKNIKKSAFTDLIRIVTDDSFDSLKFSYLGLPISTTKFPFNINTQFNKDGDHKAIKSSVKHNNKVLYHRSDHTDTQYYTGAEIVLDIFPDRPLTEYKEDAGALKYPKFVTEDMLRIPSIATSNKKIQLPKSNPTFANILGSITQLDPKKGLLGLIVDEKFLSNSLNSSIRKFLVEHDLIEMVVSINRSVISMKDYMLEYTEDAGPSIAEENRALGLTNLRYEDKKFMSPPYNSKKVALVVINLNKPIESKHKILFCDFFFPSQYGEYDMWDVASSIIRKAYKRFSFKNLTEDLTNLVRKRDQQVGISEKSLQTYIRDYEVHLDNVKFLNFDLKPHSYRKIYGELGTSFGAYQEFASKCTDTLGSICEIIKGVNLPSKNKINFTGENAAKGLVPIMHAENLDIWDNKKELVTELSMELGGKLIKNYDFCDPSKLNSVKEKIGLIDEKCVLVKLTGSHLNYLIFDPEKDFFSIKNQRYTPEEYKSFVDIKKSNPNKIFINQNIAAIKIKKDFKNKIPFDYFYYVLMGQVELANSLKKLTQARARTTIKDLESTPIKILDSIDKQNERAKKTRLELLQKIESGKIKYEQALETREVKDKAEFELTSFINHEGGRKIARINTKLKAFLDFLEKNDLENKPLQDPMPGQKIQTIGDAIADALNSSEQLRKLLAKISDLCKEEIKPQDLALENIEEVFRKNILTLDDDGIFSFKFACKASNKKIYLEKSYFIDAMENLINNAKAHGFDQGSKKKYIIEFKVSDEGKGIIIDYKNNGRELPEEIDEDIFCQIGKKGKSSSGQGIGGARIKKMLDGHLASFEIIRENSTGVHFRFSFPNEINPNQN